MLRRLLASAIISLSLVSAGRALAFSGGITTDSFSPSGGCNDCHSGGNDPAVDVIGPQYVRPLSTHEYKVRVSTFGAQVFGGFNLSTTAGTLLLGGTASAQTQLMTTIAATHEVTHTSAKAASRDYVVFSFLWTAPASFSAVPFAAWGNSVNGNNGSSGDAASSETFTVNNGGLNLCPPTPDPGCSISPKSAFSMVDSMDDTKDALSFSWGKAPTGADVGDPTTNTDYALCLYVDGNLVGDVNIPGVTSCNGVPCWSIKGDPMAPPSKVTYKDKVGAPDGVRSVKIAAAAIEPKGKVSVKAKGIDLPDLGILPLGARTLTVHFRNSYNSACFGDSFGGADVSKDDGTKFKAKASHP